MLLRTRCATVTLLVAVGAAVAQGESGSAGVRQAFDNSVMVITDRGEGAGVSLGDDVVLTAEHVIADARVVTVQHGETRLAARVTASDRERDLATLAVPGLGLGAVPGGPDPGDRRAEARDDRRDRVRHGSLRDP